MTKKPRMGRNLNALLGGAAREKTNASDQADAARSADDNNSQSGNQASDQNSDLTQGDKAQNESTDIEGSQNEQSRISPPAHDSANTAGAVTVQPVSGSSDSPTGTERLIVLGVDKIRRGSYQPRRLFDQELLQELADSIKAEGVIQPIIVRPFADGYELVAGERRWRAAQLAGISDIPAIVRSMDDKSVAAVSVIENIQRKDLNPLEEAAAFERLCDEFGMTHKAVAESVGRSRASVSNLMRLLELHDEVKILVDKGELEMGHARALLGAPRNRQPEIAHNIIKQNMTVRAVESYIRSLDAEGREKPAAANALVNDPDIERLSKKLGDKLGAPVKISHKGHGGGQLQISYSSVNELQGILAHIK